MNHTNYHPILLELHQKLENKYVSEYMDSCLGKFQKEDARSLLMTLLIIHIQGYEYLEHYKECEKTLLKELENLCPLVKSDELKKSLDAIKSSMPTWKLLLLQKKLIEEEIPQLCGKDEKGLTILDLDWTTFISFSKQREGAEVGANKKNKGKAGFNLSLAFISEVFVDSKLFPGNKNPKDFLAKHVSRSISLGYKFDAVRGDAAYGNAPNIKFLQDRKKHYLLGASRPMECVVQGISKFRKLTNAGSQKIKTIHKGLSAIDLGEQNLENSETKEYVTTRVIICRRIQRRRRKNGKYKVKHYYYAIVTDLSWSVTKIVKHYQQRQKIENAIKELKYHYFLSRMPRKGLKANEFFIITKILAMSLLKAFAISYLPRKFFTMRRKTLLRKVFDSAIVACKFLNYSQLVLKIEYRSESKNLWYVKRLCNKILANHSRLACSEYAA